jgi:transposase InsO family protein
MVHYFTAKELLHFGLPGLPTTERRIKERAKNQAWPCRPRRAKGGGVEYEVQLDGSSPSVLTPEQQAHVRAVLAERDQAAEAVQVDAEQAARAGRAEAARLELTHRLEAEAADLTKIAALKAAPTMPEAARRRMDAKAEVLRAYAAFWGAQRSTAQLYTQFLFVNAYNGGAVNVPGWVREVLPEISQRSLQRWRSELSAEGITRLGGNYGNRKGAGTIDSQPAVRELIVGMIAHSAHCRATHVIKALEARFGADPAVKLPSLRSIERWMSDWRRANAQTLMALSNPDAWRNKYMVAMGSASEGITALNQRWEMDSTPADVMLTDGRHAIIGTIDVYSRRLMLHVSKTSKATAVAACLRRALLAWGVPEMVKTDNGSDYTSRHMVRVLTGLEVRQELCPPFQPHHKPHIERVFGTFTRDLVELLSGFIGHNVAERKAIESRKSFADRLMTPGEVVEITMSAAELQDFCDRWCEDLYHHQAHEGLSGRTPFEVAAGWREHIRRIPDERALDMLLAEAPGDGGMRRVQKKGIQLDGAWFIAPELEAFVGEPVQVLYDEHDLGRVFIYAATGFVCIAECPERTGVSRTEVAARARELQKKRVQEERKALKEAGKAAKVDDIVTDILADRARKAGKLMAFPAPTVEHEAEGLRQGADAVQALEALSAPPTPHAEEDLEAGRKLIAQFEEERQRLLDVEEPTDRYVRLTKRLAGGGTVNAEEERFIRNFETTSDYRAWLMFQEVAAESQQP